MLSGEQLFSKKGSCEYQDLEYPDDCIVDFDMRLIDLFKEMDKKKINTENADPAGILSCERITGRKTAEQNGLIHLYG